MGDEEGLDLLATFHEVGHIGHHQIDAEHLLVREHQAAVDDHDLIPVLEHRQVLADLAHTAQRQDAQQLGRPFRGSRVAHWNIPI
jgi:hypothetical protein